MRVNEAVHSPLPPRTANHSTAAGPRVLIIPAFNEGKNLEHVLTAIANAKIGFETIVIDDGSPDDTGAVATRLGATLIRHPFNLGYGAALQTGYKYALEAGASLVVQMDADGQHDRGSCQGPITGWDSHAMRGALYFAASPGCSGSR
jgi:cellulose synthase/poly-beta-1,6-N-acetylglucosamine synthase-like glycosyltransferase